MANFRLTVTGPQDDLDALAVQLAGTFDYAVWLPVPAALVGVVEGFLQQDGQIYRAWRPGPPVEPLDAAALYAEYGAISELAWKSHYWQTLRNVQRSAIKVEPEQIVILWTVFGSEPASVIAAMYARFPALTFTLERDG